ncbi:MAG TPA: hypothetical protein VGG69_00550 [Rhizomicrobium sp.]
MAAVLAGCVGTTALSQLDVARPIGDAFSQDLFKNYAFLAHSFGVVGAPSSGTPFDADQSIQMGSMSADVADIANAYAAKALAVAQGDNILPEDADPALKDADAMRLQLLRDLDQGREKAPERAARAQVDYDCWMVNARSDQLRRASQACRRSLTYSLAQLEQTLAAVAPPPAPAVLPATAPAQSATPDSSTPTPATGTSP